MFRIVGELLHPIAQLRHMHAQVLRSLHIGHASLLDQAHSLKLELAGKLPSLHDPPPAPSKHLTRCLRNRVQAIDPIQFEHFVKELLDAMDYEDVRVTKVSNDKGVDVIARAQFGITEITEVVQVKRTESTITRPKVDELRGALPYHKAIRGTIISLGAF